MILTIRVPDETVKISYAVLDENGYMVNDVLLTVGDMIRVEPDEKTAEQGGMDEKPCDKIGFE